MPGFAPQSANVVNPSGPLHNDAAATHHKAMARTNSASMPRFIPPMLATLVGAPFDDPDWLFEVKWDGFRVEAVVDGGGARLWTRGEKDAAQSYFGPFLDPPTWLDAGQAIVDGEVIALDERGEPDFALLQARIKGRGVATEPIPFVYEVFDLLHLEGRSSTSRSRSAADFWLRSSARIRASA